jgi:hypothetical protein
MMECVKMKVPLFIPGSDGYPKLSGSAHLLIVDALADNSDFEKPSPLRVAAIKSLAISILAPIDSLTPDNMYPQWTGRTLRSVDFIPGINDLLGGRGHSSKNLGAICTSVDATPLAAVFGPSYSNTLERTFLHVKGCTVCDWAANHRPTAPARGLDWGDYYAFIQIVHFIPNASLDETRCVVEALQGAWKGSSLCKPLGRLIPALSDPGTTMD